jgi:hypothetical protein
MTTCQVINHTPAGYALRQIDLASAGLRIGDLVALRVEGRTSRRSRRSREVEEGHARGVAQPAAQGAGEAGERAAGAALSFSGTASSTRAVAELKPPQVPDDSTGDIVRRES